MVDFQIDGELTLESNVADVGGLKIAYNVNGYRNNTSTTVICF